MSRGLEMGVLSVPGSRDKTLPPSIVGWGTRILSQECAEPSDRCVCHFTIGTLALLYNYHHRVKLHLWYLVTTLKLPLQSKVTSEVSGHCFINMNTRGSHILRHLMHATTFITTTSL